MYFPQSLWRGSWMPNWAYPLFAASRISCRRRQSTQRCKPKTTIWWRIWSGWWMDGLHGLVVSSILFILLHNKYFLYRSIFATATLLISRRIPSPAPIRPLQSCAPLPFTSFFGIHFNLLLLPVNVFCHQCCVVTVCLSFIQSTKSRLCAFGQL